MSQLRIEDTFTARICAVLANVNRAKETERIWVPADFLLFPPVETSNGNPARPVQTEWTEARQVAMIEHLNKAFGGSDLRQRKN